MTAGTAGGLAGAGRRQLVAWRFLAPTLIVLALVAGWPLVRTIYFGFTDAELGHMEEASFVGVANYIDLLTDPDWWRATFNTLRFSLVSVTVETLLGMVVALTLHSRMQGRGLLRAAVLIPWAIPTIVSAQMWGWMFHDLYGAVNAFLRALGIIERGLAWTADPTLSWMAVIFVDVWKTTPFMALLILAGLQTLPADCYEAAKIDGCGPVRAFFLITLPLIRPALMVAVIFRVLDALRVFDLIYVLTSNSRATMSMSVYARQQLVDFQNVGTGSAAATLLFFVIALVTIACIRFGRLNLSGEG